MSVIMILLLAVCIILAGYGGGGNTQGNNAAPAATEPSSGNSSETSSDMSPEIAQIYEAAKKEGKVIYWSSDDISVPPMKEDFEKKYPGITIEHFQLNPNNVLEKVITESKANQVNVDVMEIYYSDSAQLIDRGLVRKYEWNETFAIDPSIIRHDNQVLAGWHVGFPIAYNTNLVKEDEVPKSWEELLDPKWKGKLLVEARGNVFSFLSYEWGEEKTINYVKDLMKQEPVIIKGGTASMQAIASGQAAISVGATYIHKVEEMKLKGAPMEWAKFGPIPLQTEAYVVANNSPNPNAALLLAHWLVSEDGLKIRDSIKSGAVLEGPTAFSTEAKTIVDNNIKTISEIPEKEEIGRKVQAEVQKILGSLN